MYLTAKLFAQYPNCAYSVAHVLNSPPKLGIDSRVTSGMLFLPQSRAFPHLLSDIPLNPC